MVKSKNIFVFGCLLQMLTVGDFIRGDRMAK